VFTASRAPRTRAAQEVDVSDKPSYLRRHPIAERADVADADQLYRCTLQSLQAVDRGISRLVSELRRVGELANTMIVFTSDNGFAFLEHRVSMTKGMPYEEHLRVPLVVRPPRGFPPASRSGGVLKAPVANIDLAPTILDVANAQPCLEENTCRRMDGRSLLPLLLGQKPGWTERRAIRTGFSIGAPTYGLSCSWDGLRTPQQALVNHTLLPLSLANECEAADELEYYDLESDPFQLQGDGPIPAGLEARLDRLRRCSGIEGRDSVIEGTPFCE
jgi:arylsulfatase A-like enzyme